MRLDDTPTPPAPLPPGGGSVPDSSPFPSGRGAGGAGFYWLVGGLTLLLASLPHLVGWLTAPAGAVYSGFTSNIDDSAVYLTYLRQAAEGDFFQRNQFTTEEQRSYLFNALFLVLGNVARFTHLPLPLVYNLGRVVAGGLLLWVVYLLLRETVSDERSRRLGFALACVSGGFGFLFAASPVIRYEKPVDLWQPEATLFGSLSYTVLFAGALAFMGLFALSVLRAERTGRLRDLWPAALSLVLLANFHSYDVIHLLAVATAYRLVAAVTGRRFDGAGWARTALLWFAAAPMLAYQYWALNAAGVLANRVQEPTLSGPLQTVLLGFGLALVLAALAPLLPDARRRFTSPEALTFLLTWAVVGIAVSYLPANFQRKLLMGAHLPLCLLAGPALAALTGKLSGSLPALAAGAAVVATTPTHLLNTLDAITQIRANAGSHRPYLSADEAAALRWLRENTPRDQSGSPVLVAPDLTSHLRLPGQELWPHLSVYVPAFAGNTVYNGHWSETSEFKRKLNEGWRFFRGSTDDDWRRAFLSQSGVRYVLYLNRLAEGPLKDAQGNVFPDPQTGAPYYEPAPWGPAGPPPPYLEPAYANGEVTVYRVVPEAL